MSLPNDSTEKGSDSFFYVVCSGIVMACVIVFLANALIALFVYSFGITFYIDWIGTLFMCATPMQIMFAIIWQNNEPNILRRMAQPQKGLLITGLCFICGFIVMQIFVVTVGQGQITPIFIHFIVLTVCMVPVLMMLFACWPVNGWTNKPILVGIGCLVIAYLLAMVLYDRLYHYDFLADTSFYAKVWHPEGLFNGIVALTFCVTGVFVLLALVTLDLWPVSTLMKDGRQPMTGILSLLLVLAVSFVIHTLAIQYIGMEPLDYMVRIPVSGMFGIFLVENMMQFRLFASFNQPIKGLLKLFVCAILAMVMYQLYRFLAPWIAGVSLQAGPKSGYALEIWIATAMLAITFPLINVYCSALMYWPFFPKD